jgi:hypothetical protein
MPDDERALDSSERGIGITRTVLPARAIRLLEREVSNSAKIENACDDTFTPTIRPHSGVPRYSKTLKKLRNEL